MARRQASSFSINIRGIPDQLKLPEQIIRAHDVVIERGRVRLADDIRRDAPTAAPGSSPSQGPGFLKSHIRSRRVNFTTFAVGAYGVEYARAVDRGAYMRPRQRQTRTGRPPVLRFTIGGKVFFRAQTRIPSKDPRGRRSTRFFERSLRGRVRVFEEVWQDVYGDLKRVA